MPTTIASEIYINGVTRHWFSSAHYKRIFCCISTCNFTLWTVSSTNILLQLGARELCRSCTPCHGYAYANTCISNCKLSSRIQDVNAKTIHSHETRNELCFRPWFCIIYGYAGPGTTWANEMNFLMNHDCSAGSIAWLVDQQSNTIPLYHGCPPHDTRIVGSHKQR